MKYYLKIFILLFIVVVFSKSSYSEVTIKDLQEKKTLKINCLDLKNINKIPLEIKIGQMLFVGFQGYSINNVTKDYIQKYNIGGLILFNKSLNSERKNNIQNPNQVKILTHNAQLLSRIPLFIGIDEEGGKTARLKKEQGFIEIPSHEHLNKEGINKIREESTKLAIMLKNLGINVNFAPVVDVNINSNNPIIGKVERSFSNNPNIVYKDALAFIKAQNRYSIITSIKHFPGHGSSNTDTHKGMVDVTNTWKESELLPYKLLIHNTDYNQIIMLSHIINRKLDSDYPASISYKIATELLRQKLGFKGIIITDSLDMQALSSYYTQKQILVDAINAGADILLNGNNSDKPFDPNWVKNSIKIITNAVKNGKIPLSRINESFVRIIKLKKQFNVIKIIHSC